MANENKYKYTKAYYKIKDLILNNPEEDVFVIRGGQGASKTISIIQLIIQSLILSQKEASILSSELSKMKRTVIRDYKKVCKDWNVMRGDYDWNKSESKHDYPNDSYLDFLGADVNDIGKGFRRDILYINEADRMSIDTAVQFISRAGLTIIDYNPDKLFWGDEYINDNNFITLTFEDNEYLSESEVKSILDYKKKGFYNPDLPFELLFKEENIKSKYWANKWRVYGLGLVGSIDGVVFENWREGKFNPDNLQTSFGQDYGFSVDPTTLIETAIDFKKKRIYAKEHLYRTNLTTSEIAEKNKVAGRKLIWADSAEPRLIKELKDRGNNVKAVQKVSIEEGVMFIQDFELIVDPNSTNLKNELNSYVYADKGSKLYVDANNHLIDALRYNVTGNIIRPKLKVTSSGVA